TRRVIEFLVACQIASTSVAQNWNQFRGPNGDGVVHDAKLPIKWGAKNHVLWNTEVSGVGWSSPVVWGDRIFVTTAESETLAKPDPKFTTFDLGTSAPSDVKYRQSVLCFDAASGTKIWAQQSREGLPPIKIHANNTYASETPTTDGERVVVSFGTMGIYCYD